jgi:hypothetical protein
MEFDFFQKSSGLFGRKRFVEGGRMMGVEMVADKDDFFDLRILVLDKLSHQYRPIGFGSPRRNRYRLSAVDRLYSEKDVRCPVSLVFAIIL